uniref:(northern house mosquito) hypothetical protein n=1 Tax=Culex pipiens TaxID=7175 RepID=A0A8D8E4C9_CULPI
MNWTYLSFCSCFISSHSPVITWCISRPKGTSRKNRSCTKWVTIVPYFLKLVMMSFWIKSLYNVSKSWVKLVTFVKYGDSAISCVLLYKNEKTSFPTCQVTDSA